MAIHFLATLFVALICAAAPGATVPPPERLLPNNTLLVVTAPDFRQLKTAWARSPQAAFWNDESMRPFREKFFSKWQEEIIQPLERELEVKFDDYGSLPQGQVTFAMTLNDPTARAQGEPELGTLLLLDTKDKASLLSTNLAELRQKWAAAGKPIRSEKIRGFEFSVLPLSSNDVPRTLKRLFPPTSQVQDPPSDETPPKEPLRTDWVAGQAGSLLIIGDSIGLVDRVVARLTGDALPALEETAAFNADEQSFFRNALFYGWVNVKAFMDYYTRKSAQHPPMPEDPLVPFDMEKVIAASGLAAVKTAAFALANANEGSSMKLFVRAPESSRVGLLKILAGEPKETAPPPFVPADVVKFHRWRIDGQKSWAALEHMLKEMSPQSFNALNFILDTADLAAKEKDPDFNVRKSLIGNLGDDIISYERSARGSGTPQGSRPSLYLIGSPNPQELAGSLKNVLAILNPQAGPPVEREFLGRKIFSASMPALPLPMSEVAVEQAPATLHCAASGSAVDISTDASVLEEYLRSSESQAKALKEMPGFREAMSRVAGAGTFFFAYENQAETMRATFEALKRDPGAAREGVFNPLSGLMGLAGHALDLRGLTDYSLLPAYDKVARYFGFTVSAASASVDGLTYQIYSPAPGSFRIDNVAAPSNDHVLYSAKGATNSSSQR